MSPGVCTGVCVCVPPFTSVLPCVECTKHDDMIGAQNDEYNHLLLVAESSKHQLSPNNSCKQ